MTSRAAAVAGATQRLTGAGILPADARTEAVILLRHAAAVSREELFLRPDVLLSPEAFARYESAITRRAAREPLCYITGTRDFYGLTFAVTPAVLIPRPETEDVVEAVLTSPFPSSAGGIALLDLCTGSGAIAVAVAVHLPDARVTATDISNTALVVARANADRHCVGNRVTFLAGDLFAPVPVGARFAVIAANPPYIAPDEIETLEPEVRDFEPRIALGVHADALVFYRRIANDASAYLVPGGRVVVEVGQGQADAVSDLFRRAGFTNVSAFPDLSGILRVVVAAASVF